MIQLSGDQTSIVCNECGTTIRTRALEDVESVMFDPFFTTKFIGRLGLAAIQVLYVGMKLAELSFEKKPAARYLISNRHFQTGRLASPVGTSSSGP
jgi:hypothetical protein